MYNGIGLKTARGSGTNGFVQRNMSYIRPSRMLEFSKRMEPEIMEPKMKNQDKAILEHQVKREIEVFLMDLEDKMKEKGMRVVRMVDGIDIVRKRLIVVLLGNARCV